MAVPRRASSSPGLQSWGALSQWLEDRAQGQASQTLAVVGSSLWPWPSYSCQEKGPPWRWPHTTPAAVCNRDTGSPKQKAEADQQSLLRT